MKNIITILICAIVISGCQNASKVRRLKLAHGLSETHSVHKAMVRIAEDLKERSGGKMLLDIYPGGQLGAERECVELLQIGSLAMTKVSAAVMEGFSDKYKVFGLPYIFNGKEHMYNVLDGKIGKNILLSSEKSWLRGLCYYDTGARSFYTKDKPINTPSDLNGMKIRVMKSINAMNMVKQLGGSPTPIAWGELYTALQSGVVEGAENNPPSFYLSHHYEVCKYYSIDEHTLIPDVLLMSSIVWNKLSEQEQKWLQESVNVSVPYQRKLWDESEKEALREVKKAGVKINYPDKSPFSAKVQKLYEDYKQNSEVWDLITDIRNAK